MSAILLHLMRHGPPETPGLLLGRTDAAPLPSGIDACVRHANGLAINTLVSSDLSRARRAADAIGAHRRMPVTIDPRWRELDFGDWDGLAPSQVDAAALTRFWDDPDTDAPPGGESWSRLVARVTAAIADLRGSTLVMTHGGTMRAALAHLCGLSPTQCWAIDLPYGALLSLRIWPGATPSGQIVGLRS